MTIDYDVAIIGGGPAGSTAATLLAQKGRRVVVLEREKFPRFHIGESLLPYSVSALDRLGIREKVEAMAVRKVGGEIATSCGTKSVKFYFKNGFHLPHHSAYQVLRSDFDKLLLDHSVESGADVREETAVEALELDDEGVTLTMRAKGGVESAIRAKYLIDCSGRNAVVGNRFKLKKSYPNLQKFSAYAHFDSVPQFAEDDTNLTRLIRGVDHWFWMIAVSPTRTSVGVVVDTSTFKKLRETPEQILDRYLNAGEMVRRMAGSTRVSPVYSTADYSYRNTRLTGDRWLLAGDAAGFIDPIFSTGVFLAILSGEQAADIFDKVLTDPNTRPALFRRYERKMNRVMDMYLRFVDAWYRREFVEVFSSPTERFQLAPAINAVLAGNVGSSFAIWWRMQLFYLVLYLQRFVALCPRLALTPAMQP
jgi:FADH2-dependent halogenase